MQDTITAEAALSDQILQAARAIVVRHQASLPVYYGSDPWAGCGVKNPPLLTLLDQLVGACEPVANAIADNCNDDDAPLPFDGAKNLAQAFHAIGDIISACAEHHCAVSMPSMTGKELI